MNPLLSVNRKSDQVLYPIQVLDQLVRAKTNGCLIVNTNSVEWRLYFAQGQLTYGTHSVEPFERLERHLRRLSHQNPQLTSSVRAKVRSLAAHPNRKTSVETNDYQAVSWLIGQKYITIRETTLLIQGLLKEILESYLLLKTFTYDLISYSLSPFVHFPVSVLLEDGQVRFQNWQKLAPYIESPYQRPYLSEQSNNSEKLSPNQREKLKKILIGLNFRQLAVLVNQDELTLAKNLHPLIVEGLITLQEPQPPFNLLPKIISEDNPVKKLYTASPIVNKINVVCVDDSPVMLKAIEQFLRHQNMEIFTINDPIKALREIVRLEPKLILLDIGMPNLDGYRLCRLIRNHSLFKETPIVMVTGNTGVLDRAKAKVAGATDYLTKPFSQAELEKIVLRYLPK